MEAAEPKVTASATQVASTEPSAEPATSTEPSIIDKISDAVLPPKAQHSTTVRLLYPQNYIDSKVCKATLSARLLGYPPPTMINYGKVYLDGSLRGHGSHLAKITGTLDYLKTLKPEDDNDIVILMDALDTWFQLRPSVLIERFYDINRRADDRLRSHMSPYSIETGNIRQKVVISTQKSCWPVAKSDPGCAMVPESTLPENLFGEGTDFGTGDPAIDSPARKIRYRFLNSGSVIGSVAAVRDIMERASEYVADGPHNYKGSDQGIFADIFGEQEVGRHILSLQGQGDGSAPSLADFNLTEGRNYEFGIGMDYENLLVLATQASANETEWIKYNDPAKIAEISKKMNMTYPHVGSLPAEIARSPRPFVDNEEVTWEDVPLYTLMRTGYTPVVVHHNEWPYHAKQRIDSMWKDVWFQPHALAMLDREKAAGATGKVEYTSVEVGGEVHNFWGAPASDVMHLDKGQDISWWKQCKPAYDILFKGQAA